MPPIYTGRFAPSPTGPLHFGSLIAALASFLDARAQGGRWLVRMEDIDPPREMPGAAALILRQLEQHGLEWDGDVLYQGMRRQVYRQALDQLLGEGIAYPCDCTRQQVRAMGGVYDGRCFHRQQQVGRDGNAIRLHIAAGSQVSFDDLFQGPQRQNLAAEVGDFVIHRRDGLVAYQLAVAVDDAEQGITHVVRGSDLLDSTPRQIHLLRVLGRAVPQYGHLPVATGVGRQKLSKQNLARSLQHFDAVENLRQALAWLGMGTVRAVPEASVTELLGWAVNHWNRAQVPACLSLPAPAGY